MLVCCKTNFFQVVGLRSIGLPTAPHAHSLSLKKQSSYYSFKPVFMGSARIRACRRKGYLACVKDPLWVRDILGTELMLGH